MAMPRLTTRRLRLLGARLGFQRDWYLVFVAAGIGLVMGGIATAFILPLRWIEEWAESADRQTLIWLVPIAPVLGVLLMSVFLRLVGRDMEVPGVSAVMYAIHRQRARIPLGVAARKWIASTLTIGSGGSAGAEGPIVTIGSAIGSSIASALRANPQYTATFLGCAAAAGIASVFNAPIAGIFFVLEILLRDFSLRTFTPIVIASVVSSAWTQALLGRMEPLFLVSPEFFRPDGYQTDQWLFSIVDIPNFVLLGLVCGIVSVVFIRGLIWSENAFDRLKAPSLIKPVIGAAMLGVLGLGYMLLFASTPHSIPPFYGNGYPVIRNLLQPMLYTAENNGNGMLLMLLVALFALKAIATWLTIGSGGSGGLFAPTLLMGAAVGGAFGQVVNMLELFPAANPAHYALVGMAAMIAATAHAPLTGILIVYEVTLQYEIILPLMLTAVISTFVGRLLYSESVYTFKLSQLGIRVGGMSDLTILRRLCVQDVPLAPAILVHTDESAHRLLELSEQHLVRDFVVVDDKQRYVGLVTGDDLSAALVYREAIPLLQVHELQRTDVPTVTIDETLDQVMDKFAQHDVQSLAVLDRAGTGIVRGLITRARLMDRYQAALSRD